MASEGLPDHVQVALAEVASAAREGVLAKVAEGGLRAYELKPEPTELPGVRRTQRNHANEPPWVP